MLPGQVDRWVMSKPWGSFHQGRPVWFALITAARPRCFVTAESWECYLEAVHQESQDDEALRARLHRGQPPDYCEDCTARHQLRMHAAGRCEPPPGAQSPLMPIELAGALNDLCE